MFKKMNWIKYWWTNNYQYIVESYTNSTLTIHSLTKRVTDSANVWFLLYIYLLLTLFMFVRRILQGWLFVSSSKRNAKTQIPLSLFDMAKVAYKDEMCNRLIQVLTDFKSFDVNQKMPVVKDSDSPKNQLTLFQCACFSGSERLLRYLLYNGGDINAKTKWNDSPLHLVTFALSSDKNKEFGAVEVLLEAGCEVNCKNWIGNTPLSIAASHGNIKLIKYLLGRGANPSISNNKGIYPIDFANNADHIEAAELLLFDVPNPHVWDVIEPHTPPKIKLGLQTPSKQHLVDSTFTRRKSQRKRDKQTR